MKALKDRHGDIKEGCDYLVEVADDYDQCNYTVSYWLTPEDGRAILVCGCVIKDLFGSAPTERLH